MHTVIREIIVGLNLHEGQVIVPKYRQREEITIDSLIQSILEHETLEAACKFLNTSITTVKRHIRFNNDKKQSIKYYLLALTSYKHCSTCKKILKKEFFTVDNSTVDKLSNYCKSCKSNYNKASTFDRKTYVAKNRAAYNFRNSKYRAAKLRAIPKWADLDKIKEIYDKCPAGFHVDHEIPLQGKSVCGLHVENNLQYLLAEDNLSKGNNYKG